MNKLDKIVGKFSSTIFHNADNFYTVARFELDDLNNEVITVVGHIKDMDEGSLYELMGEYVDHPRFGIQFAFEGFSKRLPTDGESLIKYLSSPIFPGIGEKTAEIIVDSLGADLIEKIKNNPEVIDSLDIAKKQKKTLYDGIVTVDDFDETIAFFSTYGLGIRNIIRLDKAYGTDAIAKIKENPYRLVEEVSGIGFKTADKLAKNMEFDMDSAARYEAVIIELVMNHIANTGDSYITLNHLNEQFIKSFSDVSDQFMDYLMNIMMRRTLILEDDKVYHHTQYDSEETIATVLKHFPVNKLDRIAQKDIDIFLNEIEKEVGIEYDASQVAAINKFLESDFSILTGGPGTGKTTIIRAMVLLYKKLYPEVSIALCAPTGRAAKRLKELTHNDSFTVHSLLNWDLETNTFGVNETNPLPYDIIVIDEFSMVDQWLFAQLLKASAGVKKILIVGDENQLPSVLPGSALRDLIASQQFPVVRLSEIYRQKEGSAVVELADNINRSQYQSIEFKDDVAFIEAQPSQVNGALEQVVNNYLTKGFTIDEIQILAPMYKGASGINTINNRLQEVLNPASLEKHEFKYGYRTFREGDKLLQLKNQTDDEVYNGDIGTLIEIDNSNPQERLIYVDFDGNIVEYSGDSINHLTHAYCISIHKSQGSEYPIVIMPIVRESIYMLQKKLLYTGITRAKRSLILIGDKQLFLESIQREERHQRYTTLKEKLLR